MLLIGLSATRNDILANRQLVHNQSYDEVLRLGPLDTPSEDVEAQDDEFDDDDDDAEADEDEVADDEGADPDGSEDSPDAELDDHR